jgi:hypothetical protein
MRALGLLFLSFLSLYVVICVGQTCSTIQSTLQSSFVGVGGFATATLSINTG